MNTLDDTKTATSIDSWDIATKIDILKHVQTIQLEEIQHRRAREYQIFSWTSGLLVALIGALLVFPQAPHTIWSAYGIPGKLAASVGIAFFALHSINWQLDNRQVGGANARVIVRINKLFHLFEKRYYDHADDSPLLPTEWEKWGEDALATPKPSYFRALLTAVWGANFISPILLLMVLAIAMIWVN